MTIILYDLPSTRPGGAWSPNTWRTRFALNFKGIPYVTEWVEWPDIEARSKELGIEPTSKRADGSPRYTLPAIHDPSTGAALADSLRIAEYLEKTYPDTPKLFPPGADMALQTTFADVFRAKLANRCIFGILSAQARVLPPRSAEAFRGTMERQFGAKLEDLVPQGDMAVAEWAKFRTGMDDIDAMYAKSGGPFLLGETVSWADFVAAAYAIWWRIIWGEDSAEWKDISTWNGGRWSTLLSDLKSYQSV